MAAETGISWCDSTFNPWIGCTKVSPACDNCYAEISTPSRTMGIEWGQGKPRIRTSAANWKQPLQWNRQAQIKRDAWDRFIACNPGLSDVELLKRGFIKPSPPRVFCASLADVFDNEVHHAWLVDLFYTIKITDNLDWLILTKRISVAQKKLPFFDWVDGWDNVWLGISVVNQAEFDRDVPKLVAIPAKIRWLSIEPMLGPIEIPEILGRHIDWIVVGGESGPNARPMERAWVASLINQCCRYSIPFFFKQWGGKGRDKGGCLYDGGEIKDFPGAKP
jgi:protein gp37